MIEECLTKEEAAKLKHLNIERIMLLTAEERIDLFSSLIGSKANWFNSRFEKDFILKPQKAGLLEWANKKEMKDKFRKEIIRRISELEKALNPEEEKNFMGELTKLALGVGVTREEEQTIFDLSKKADEARLRMLNGSGSREDYEKACKVFEAYVEELKNS